MAICKKLLSVLLIMAVLFGMAPISADASADMVTISAPVFPDMPNDWSTEALQSAVDNGLLTGSNGRLLPKSYLTRAQMAAIVTRAFGATVEGDLSSFSDVKASDWFADEMAKAYQMGVIKGSNGKMNPNSSITRQEVFVILARALKLEPAEKINLTFTDTNQIADWAKGEIYAVVNSGYLKGSNGKLNPRGLITRAEFAQFMYNILKSYISEPGEYTQDTRGNVMINKPGVTLKNMTIIGDLIIGDGVGDGEVVLDGVVVTGRTVIRGGGENSIKVVGNSELQNIIIARVDGAVRVLAEDGTVLGEVTVDGSDDVIIEGFFGNITIVSPGITVRANNASIDSATIQGENSIVQVGEGSSIGEVTVNGAGSSISGAGSVGTVTANANDVAVTVQGADVTAGEGTSGVRMGDKVLEAGQSGIVGGSPRIELTGVTITGSVNVNSTLTAKTTPENATASYQWMISATQDGAYTNIAGATEKTYKPVSGDLGKFLKVTAKGTGNYSHTVTSAATAEVKAALPPADGGFPPPPPPPTTTPVTAVTIAGTVKVGSVLTANPIPATATVSYQWMSCDTADGTYVNISGATAKTYTLVAGDLGKFIKVKVTGTGSYTGSVTSSATVAAAPGEVSAVTISGAAKVNSVLTANTTPADATVTYQWMSCDTAGGTYTDVSSAVYRTYTLGMGDLGKYFKVKATGTGAFTGTVTSSATAAITLTVISIDNITGVTVPAAGAAPVTTLADTAQYTAAITWSPVDAVFDPYTVYTATITITPKTGYTLTGVAANFFKVGGATATNAANAGVVTAVFPKPAAAALAAATAEVVKAEGSKLQADLDAAQALVTALPAGQPKNDLQTRISTLQAEIYTVGLTAAKAAAAGKVQADYTTASWTAFSNAKAEADALPEGTSQEIIAKTAAINNAIALLVPKADLTAYNAALSAVVEADYTTESWAAYQLIVAANAVTAEDTQTAVNTATQNITAAQSALVYSAGKLLELTKARAAALAEADYTAESWAALTTALSLAESTDAEKTSKITAIDNAIAALETRFNIPLGAVVLASDTSSETYKNIPGVIICANGVIPSNVRTQMASGGKMFLFAPGAYLIQGSANHLTLGSNTTIKGMTDIIQPTDLREIIYPDEATQAIFETRVDKPETTICDSSDIGYIQTVEGATNVTIEDIFMSGYVCLKLNTVYNAHINNVVVHNYIGTWPSGHYCNIGYGTAVGSIWVSGPSDGVYLDNCNLQMSFHHAFAVHSSNHSVWTKNVYLNGCRALHPGAGVLNGQTATDRANAAERVPETGGVGYYDWSVGFDICETASVDTVELVDCYAWDAWKVGFYSEPYASDPAAGGYQKNVKLINCRSDDAGQRSLLVGSDPLVTKVKESEACNFYFQGGYFENCVSYNGLKSGFLFQPLNDMEANPVSSDRVYMVNCVDRESAIGIVVEMYGAGKVYINGFTSLDPDNYAMRLFGGGNFQLSNIRVDVATTAHPPIQLGYMMRQQVTMSRDLGNQNRCKVPGIDPKTDYDAMRCDLINSTLSGQVYGYPVGNIVTLPSGSRFNGSSDPAVIAANITRQEGSLDKNALCPVPPTGTPQDATPSAPTGLTGIKPTSAANNDGQITGTSVLMEYKLSSAGVYIACEGTSVTNLVPGSYNVRYKAVGDIPAGYDANVVIPEYIAVVNPIAGAESKKHPDWQSYGYYLGDTNTGTVNVHFYVTPHALNIDSQIAYIDSSTVLSGTGFDQLAIQVRMNNLGYFDCRNGGTIAAKNTVNYTAEVKYYVEIEANMTARTYSVWVTPAGGSRTLIAENYAFRTSAPLTNDLGKVFFISETANNLFSIENHVVE